QRLLLVGHVVLHHLDQVGNEVMAALQLDVDLLPGVAHLVADSDQPVVEQDDDEGDNDQHAQTDEQRHGTLSSPLSRQMPVPFYQTCRKFLKNPSKKSGFMSNGMAWSSVGA